MSDQHHAGHHPLFDELEGEVASARQHIHNLFSNHHLLEALMSGLDNLIANGRKLKDERAKVWALAQKAAKAAKL